MLPDQASTSLLPLVMRLFQRQTHLHSYWMIRWQQQLVSVYAESQSLLGPDLVQKQASTNGRHCM